jgi:hypothetical protein
VFQILGSGLNFALWRALAWWLAVGASLTLSWAPSVTPKVKSQWVRCGVVHGGPYTRYAFPLAAVRKSYSFKVPAGVPLFCVVTAVSSSGIESGASNEIKVSP